LGLGNITLDELQTAAEISLQPNSDIYRLPFTVALEHLMAAMVSTAAPNQLKIKN
jgi:glycerol dehydrogenase